MLDNERILVISRNITQQKQAQHQQITLTLQQERIKMLNDFISNFSHDFRTPLAIINTNIYLLNRRLTPEELRKRLQRIQNQILRLESYIDSILALTTLESQPNLQLAIARRMGLSLHEIVIIRRAALVHDLGHIAIPGHILMNESRLSEADKEKLRLHPYYTERILSRVPALATIAGIAGMHHEHIDGTGYYRGLTGAERFKQLTVPVNFSGDSQKA